MRKYAQILFSILFVATTTGCGISSKTNPQGSAQSPTPNQESNGNTRTPEFAGGPESENRIGQPLHKTVGGFTKGELYYQGSSSEKRVALTFDDGPDVTYTNEILNILKDKGLKATFFIVGQRAEAHPEMVRRILSEGHAIGNHTWDHPKMTKLSDEQIREEINKTNNILSTIAGYTPAIFRPPYGLADQRVIQDIAIMNMNVIDWSVDTRDWAGTPPATIMDYVKKEMKPGGIILEHCAGGKGEDLSNTVKALPEIIEYLGKEGYRFTTIPELLAIPAAIKK
ncbi:MAG TPA: polysaccharide deacetylase family protein [Bacillota bacterium]|nr:polysaccharide deacetylase family protein [Bacillota bacterium]